MFYPACAALLQDPLCTKLCTRCRLQLQIFEKQSTVCSVDNHIRVGVCQHNYSMSMKIFFSQSSHLVYSPLAHKDDPLQVSAGRPAPTIGTSELRILLITSDNSIYMYHFQMYHLYYSSWRIASRISLILSYAVFPPMCAVVTCNQVIVYMLINAFFSEFNTETKSV